MRDGACRLLDLNLGKSVVPVQDVDDSALYKATVFGDVQNLKQYVLCNSTFQQLQRLSASSSECKRVLDAFLFRDVDGSIVSIDKDVCRSDCFFDVRMALKSSANTCSKLWKEYQFSGKYSKLLYKKLYIVSTAHFWSEVACFANHKGQQCTRSIFEYPQLFGACPMFNKSAWPHPLLSAPFFVPPSSVIPMCPAGCADALIEYQKMDGCCASTVAQRAAQWADLLSVTDDKTRGLFRMNLGETANPWTPLGDVKSDKLYGPVHDCKNTTERIYPQCLLESSFYCNFPAWRPPCCDFECKNDGSKTATGDCFCSCPLNRVGAACQMGSIHVRIDIVFPDEDRSTFHYGKMKWLQESLEVLLQVKPDTIEFDSLKDLTRRSGRRLQQSGPAGLRVIVRILVGQTREAVRIAALANLAILDDDPKSEGLAEKIAENAQNRWIPTLRQGSFPAFGLDTFGRELCDGIQVMCVYQKVQDGNQNQNSTLQNEASNATLVIATAILGAVTAVLLIAAFLFFVRRQPWWRAFLARCVSSIKIYNPKMMTVKRPVPDEKFQEDMSHAYKKKTSVLFEESSTPVATQFSNSWGNKSGNSSARNNNLFESLAPSGNLQKSLAPSSGTHTVKHNGSGNFVVLSDLVFDIALSTEPLAAVPTREETGNVHDRFTMQGKRNPIESPHGMLFGSTRDSQLNKEVHVRMRDENTHKGLVVDAKNVSFKHFDVNPVPEVQAAAAPTIDEVQCRKTQILQRLKLIKTVLEKFRKLKI
jgi:hypothetical protein